VVVLCSTSDGERLVASLFEVLVKCQSLVQSAPLHHNERDGVRERVPLVRAILKPTPPGSKKIFGYLNHLNPRTSEQSIANFDSLPVMASAVEKRHHLIKDVGGGDNRRNLGQRLPSVANCLLVMLII
jgi:hypothetical protein